MHQDGDNPAACGYNRARRKTRVSPKSREPGNLLVAPNGEGLGFPHAPGGPTPLAREILKPGRATPVSAVLEIDPMHRDALYSALLLMLLMQPGTTAAFGGDRYEQDVEKWRRQREADLKADDGWLTVSGLFWLRPGETRIGSDPSNDILLPAHAPSSVGTATLQEGRVRFRVRAGRDGTARRQGFPIG